MTASAMLCRDDGRTSERRAVVRRAAAAYRIAFGERLVAAYALGSLAHGGFSPLVIDVDLGVIVADPVRTGDGETVEAVADAQKGEPDELAERLSIFWGTPSTLRGEREGRGGAFPPSIAWICSRAVGCCTARTSARVCRALAPQSC